MNIVIVMALSITPVVMYLIIISHHRTPPPLVEGAAVAVLLLAEAHLEAVDQTIGLETIIPMIGVETIGVEMIMKLQSIGMMVSTYSLFYVLV